MASADHHITTEQLRDFLDEYGAVPQIGQISPADVRKIESHPGFVRWES